MKSAGKRSLHKLVIDDKFDHQFFGIVSHDPDYKTSLKINEKLNISLKTDKPACPEENDKICFSRFTSKSRYNDLSYQLVSNRSDSSILSKNFPSLDFLFVICGSLNNEIVGEAQKKIREITEVTAVFILDKENLTEEYFILQTL